MQPQCHDEQDIDYRNEQVNPLSIYNIRVKINEGTHISARINMLIHGQKRHRCTVSNCGINFLASQSERFQQHNRHRFKEFNEDIRRRPNCKCWLTIGVTSTQKRISRICCNIGIASPGRTGHFFTLLMVTHDKELARRVPRVIEIIDGNISRDEYVNGVE